MLFSLPQLFSERVGKLIKKLRPAFQKNLVLLAQGGNTKQGGFKKSLNSRPFWVLPIGPKSDS